MLACIHKFCYGRNCYLHIHILIIVELAASRKSFLYSKNNHPYICLSAVIIMDVHSTTIRHSASMTCCTPITPSPSGGCDILWGKLFSPINTELLLMELSFQCWCHCTSTSPINSVWLTWLLCDLLHVTSTTTAMSFFSGITAKFRPWLSQLC